MSFWSIIGRAIGLVPAVVDAVSAIADAARSGKDKPRDIRREHFWLVGLSDPPRCAYCTPPAIRTPQNEHEKCPAFEVKS